MNDEYPTYHLHLVGPPEMGYIQRPFKEYPLQYPDGQIRLAKGHYVIERRTSHGFYAFDITTCIYT